MPRELETLRQELAKLEERAAGEDEKGRRRKERQEARAAATDADFTPEALMGTIDEAMEAAELNYEVVAVDCDKKSCLFFGTFDFSDPTIMGAWVRFRESMYDRGRPLFSTQFSISETKAVFAIAPSLDNHSPYELMRRADPVLKHWAAEMRSN